MLNLYTIGFISVPGQKPYIDLIQKFELTVPEVTEGLELSIMDVHKIFKNAHKKYSIRGKAFLFRHENQLFFITPVKDDFKIYKME